MRSSIITIELLVYMYVVLKTKNKMKKMGKSNDGSSLGDWMWISGQAWKIETPSSTFNVLSFPARSGSFLTRTSTRLIAALKVEASRANFPARSLHPIECSSSVFLYQNGLLLIQEHSTQSSQWYSLDLNAAIALICPTTVFHRCHSLQDSVSS